MIIPIPITRRTPPTNRIFTVSNNMFWRIVSICTNNTIFGKTSKEMSNKTAPITERMAPKTDTGLGII